MANQATSHPNQYWGTGRRKCSVARVRLVPGAGNVFINERTADDYIGNRPSLTAMMRQPLLVTELEGQFDIHINVFGGGLSGQLGAIRLGIARALLELDSDKHRSGLKVAGLLTRDARVKERKKYGRKRARKRFQFSKR